MKKYYVAALIVLAVILVTPKIISSQVKDHTEAIVETIQDRIQSGQLKGYSIEMLSYNEGWFSSYAQYKLAIDYREIVPNSNIPEDFANPEVLVNVTTFHGPIFFTAETGLGWVRWDASAGEKDLVEAYVWEGERAFYESTTTRGLFGGWTVVDSMPAITLTEKLGTTGEFSGYQGSGYSSHEGFNYNATIPFFRLDNPDVSINLDNFEIVTLFRGGFMQALEGKIEDSSFALSIESYKQNAKQAGNPSGAFKNIDWLMSVVANHDKDSISFSQKFSIEEFQLAEYQANNLVLDMELNSISREFAEAYQKFSQQLAGSDPETVPQLSNNFIQNNLLELLSNEPEFNITKLSANLIQGQFVLVSDNKIVEVSALPETLEDPRFWLEHLDSQSNLIADQAVVELIAKNYMYRQVLANPNAAGMTQEQIDQLLEQQVPVMLQALQNQGMLVMENDVYKVDFAVKDAEALLNGNPMPLPF